jgi:hypothetical protein
MHLLISHASLGQALADEFMSASLACPALERLLQSLTLAARDEGDTDSFNLPHERVLARSWGWPVQDGLLPLAAVAAHADGAPVFSAPPGEALGWGLLQPSHWRIGREQIALADPAELALDEAESRALFEALRPLFADDGWRLFWGDARRWYVCHASLNRLPTASPDRVVGQAIDPWLRGHPEAKRIRRLQAEAQMVWHEHPVNLAREERGQDPVNSFWLSGTGPTPDHPPSNQALQLDTRLRAASLSGDAPAWREAWAALDAGPVQALLHQVESGQPAQFTLCGDRHAFTWAPRPRAWWHRGPLRPRAPGLAATFNSL